VAELLSDSLRGQFRVADQGTRHRGSSYRAIPTYLRPRATGTGFQ
jgi:hypothetical protein